MPLLALAVLLRLVGIGYGLPHVYNADEPHIVNMAVSLSASLRPYSFKYPTLWPAVLAAAYGIWFVFWSGFGFLRGTVDFAAKYGFSPGGFYLIARLLAAVSQIGAVALLARHERGLDNKRWPYGAAALAVSPLLVEVAHSAKPDSFMFLLVTGAFLSALRFQGGGRRLWLFVSAFMAGLACSAQYTAVPAGLVVPLAWLLRSQEAPLIWLFEAGFVSACGFLIGTPYAAIDFSRFLSDWHDAGLRESFAPHRPAETAGIVFGNIGRFGGDYSLAGLAAVLGFGALLRHHWRRALLLFIPIATYVVVLAPYLDGSNARYLLGAFPALALLAGEGFVLLSGSSVWRRSLIMALAVTPGFFLSWRSDVSLLLPDTRAEATEWLLTRIPSGSTLLLDQPHAGPFVIMTKEQCLHLAERAAKNGSPRAKLFRAMAAGHPGGGYNIYRVKRSAQDLWSAPRQVALSQADQDFIDVRPGLEMARAARVDYVFTSSLGVDPKRSPEFAPFFSELKSSTDLVREFSPEPGKTVGPWLRVYRLVR